MIVGQFVSFRRARLALAVSAILGVAVPAPLAAQGDLLIAPTRLILDGRRGGEVTLSNIGAEEATYRITLELRRMTPTARWCRSRRPMPISPSTPRSK